MVLADATQAWWEALLVIIWMVSKNVLFPILVTVCTALLAKYLKIKIDDKKRAKIDEYLGKAVDYADQKLKKALDEGEKPKDKNASRTQWAKEFIEKGLETELDDKLVDYLEDLIEAKLGAENKKKEKSEG